MLLELIASIFWVYSLSTLSVWWWREHLTTILRAYLLFLKMYRDIERVEVSVRIKSSFFWSIKLNFILLNSVLLLLDFPANSFKFDCFPSWMIQIKQHRYKLCISNTFFSPIIQVLQFKNEWFKYSFWYISACDCKAERASRPADVFPQGPWTHHRYKYH